METLHTLVFKAQCKLIRELTFNFVSLESNNCLCNNHINRCAQYITVCLDRIQNRVGKQGRIREC